MRDHCHIVGNYRGDAHSRCNIAYRISKFEWKLPVVMHNIKGYGGHLIVRALKGEGNSTEHGEVSLHHCGQTQVHRLRA